MTFQPTQQRKPMKRLALALAMLCGLTAAAQTNPSTPVTATQLLIGGQPITAGLVTVTPVDSSRTAIAITTADGKLYLPGGLQTVITNGAITGFSVPDQCTAQATTPNTPISMRVDIVQTSNGKPAGPVATFISPATAPFFCGASPVALDHYSTTQIAVSSGVGLFTGPTAPLRCTPPAYYYPNTSSPAEQVCVGNVFVPVAASGSSLTFAGAWSSTASYIANASAVLRNGSTYVAKQNNTNQDPATATTYWQLLAQAGAPGSTGPAGPAPSGTGMVKVNNGAAGLAAAGQDFLAPITPTAYTCNGTLSIPMPTTGYAVSVVTVTGNCTVSFGAVSTAVWQYNRLIILPNTSGYVVTLPASNGTSMVWAGGSTPAPAPANYTSLLLGGTSSLPILGGL